MFFFDEWSRPILWCFVNFNIVEMRRSLHPNSDSKRQHNHIKIWTLVFSNASVLVSFSVADNIQSNGPLEQLREPSDKGNLKRRFLTMMLTLFKDHRLDILHIVARLKFVKDVPCLLTCWGCPLSCSHRHYWRYIFIAIRIKNKIFQ